MNVWNLFESVKQRAASVLQFGRADGVTVNTNRLSARSTLQEFFDGWFQSNVLEGDHDAKPSTIEDYKLSLRYWREATGDPSIGSIVADTYTAFKKHLKQATFKRGPNSTPRPLSECTITKHVRQISSILSRVGHSSDGRSLCAGLVDKVPYLRVPTPKHKAPKLPLTLDQCRAVLIATRKMPAERMPQQWFAYLAVLYYAGFRFDEARKLTPAMIAERNGRKWITLPGKIIKTKNDKTKPLHPDLERVLASLPQPADPNQPYFDFKRHKRTLSRYQDELQLQAGIPKSLGFHGWRRTHGEQVLFIGIPAAQKAAQKALDHSSSEITSRYYCNADALLLDRLPSILPDDWDTEGRAAA